LYRTGDFGKIVNGRVYYEGRQDMQVRLRCHNKTIILLVFTREIKFKLPFHFIFKVNNLKMNKPILFFLLFLQVKVRGQRMNLGEIEAALRSMEAEISEVVVLVTDRGEPRQAIVAFCQPSKSR
jgi:hypothetical protein